ncbi:flagella basal body P-ring formation protein FlgA [bacterium]|jgi:flagella basal body P-ring formation protein FlgA|nr:flagella basal body P-ring formation protein FlgA [bacterium]
MKPFRISLFLFLLAATCPPAMPADVTASALHTLSVTSEDSWLVTISALLTERYNAKGTLVLNWNRPRPSAAPADADLELIDAPSELAPQLLLGVLATTADGTRTRYTLVLRAELWRIGAALRIPAAAGMPLLSEDIESRRYDALRERDVLMLEEGSELDFARAVPAGRLLTSRDVLRRPLVRRGQSIDVVASDGSLTVSLRAIALHDAARGDPVRVRNPDSKREFTANVTGLSVAAIRF